MALIETHTNNRKGHLWWQASMLLLIYLLFEYEYRNFLVTHFVNLQFAYSFDLLSFGIGIAFVVLSLISLFVLKPTPFLHAISVAAITLFLFPSVIIYQHLSHNPIIPFAALLFIILLRVPLKDWGRISKVPILTKKGYDIIFITLTLIVLVYVLFDLGFNFPELKSITDTSEQYASRRDINLRLSTFSHYALGQLIKTIIPVVMLIAISKKRYWLLAFCIVIVLWLFVVYPHKTTLFMLAPVLLFALFKHHRNQAIFYLAGLLIGIIVTMFLTRLGFVLPESLLIRRTFFTQAYITYAYTDFFANSPIWFSNSFASRFIAYPYEVEPAFEIARHYFGLEDMRCNTGFLGDGCMNMGYPGMFLFTIGTAALFQFISQLKLRPIYFGLSFMILYNMLNLSPLTMILTHGLLLMLLLMLFRLRDFS